MHQFKYQGFGKYRNNLNSKKRPSEEDEDTDGQYNSEVDADGNGTNVKVGKRKCKHRTIEEYKCTKCNFKMTRFGTFFDSGIINQYMRILAMSDSEECAKGLDREMDLIYEAYNPTNII
jgi:hypothetical protein